jgi:hypothetical protein
MQLLNLVTSHWSDHSIITVCFVTNLPCTVACLGVSCRSTKRLAHFTSAREEDKLQVSRCASSDRACGVTRCPQQPQQLIVCLAMDVWVIVCIGIIDCQGRKL